MPNLMTASIADRNVMVLMRAVTEEECRAAIKSYSASWRATKRGRNARAIDGMEMGFYYTDGKLAATMWIDMYPPPPGEPRFHPAKGAIPGLAR